MQRAHKIRLQPTKAQAVLLRKTAGAARFAYNWAKAEWDKQYIAYREGKASRPDVYSMSRRWTKEKPEWASETARQPQTEAILNLGKAMINFWNKRAGPPMFRKKSDRVSFKAQSTKCRCVGKQVYIQGIGWVKMREELRFQGKCVSFTVSSRAGQWYVSVQVQMPDPEYQPNSAVVGVDVGIKHIAVASDGSVCENPLLLYRKEAHLRRLQRKLSRQRKGSSRRQRTKNLIARAHLRIVNVRQDRIHKFTSQLSKNHGTAVTETLSVRKIQEKATKSLRRNLQDTAMAEVHRQLEYKMQRVEKAPAFFPSSKRCSACHSVKQDFPCGIRVYKCEHCGHVQDRDLNAALNLKDMPWGTGQLHGKGAQASTHRVVVNPVEKQVHMSGGSTSMASGRTVSATPRSLRSARP